MSRIGWFLTSFVLLFGVPTQAQRLVIRSSEGEVHSMPLAETASARVQANDVVWLIADDGFAARVTPSLDINRVVNMKRAWLTVHVPRPGRFERPIVLIAAPVAMWQEIPETFLPRWTIDGTADGFTVPYNGRDSLRLRAFASDLGTWWIDVPPAKSAVRLDLESAASLQVRAVDPKRTSVRHPSVSVLSAEATRGGPPIIALARGDDNGTFAFPSLPRSRSLILVVGAADFTPSILRGMRDDFPAVVELRPGTTVTARVIDKDQRPLRAARVRAEAWLAGDGVALFSRTAVTDDQGGFTITNAPRKDLTITAAKSGYAEQRLTVSVKAAKVDAGVITLVSGKAARLDVRDDLNQPVLDAYLDRQPPKRVLVVNDVPPDGIDVTIDAPCCLARRVRVIPTDGATRVRLQRAYVLTGKFVGPDDQPPPAPSLQINVDQKQTWGDVDSTGSFRIKVEPRSRIRLTLSSPSFLSVVRTLETGGEGEHRDLGKLRAERGRSLTGRIVSSRTGEPVRGARVWAPRSESPYEAVLAWAKGELVETTSDDQGSFVLRGLPAAPARIRVSAAGYATAAANDVLSETMVADAGTVELRVGSTVILRRPSDDDGDVTVRADLPEGYDFDAVSVPLRAGQAIIRHLPPGHVLLSVVNNNRVLCSRSVDLADEEMIETSCDNRPAEVRGRVTLGHAAVSGGSLLWSSVTPSAPVEGAIFNRRSPAGALQQTVYGATGSIAPVPVASDGTFVTQDVTPDAYNVAWLSPSGGITASRRVLIPEGRCEIELDFDGGAIRGRVVREDGSPAFAARVHEMNSHGVAIADQDGMFRLAGMPPGRVRLIASVSGKSSDPAPAEVSLDHEIDIGTLIIRTQPAAIRVAITSESYAPSAGALVFFDTGEGFPQIFTADSQGGVEIRPASGIPERARIAAAYQGRWAFGDWLDAKALGAPVSLAIPRSGSLRIRRSDLQAFPTIVTSNGWDLSKLLQLFAFARSDNPLLLTGLPPATYSVSSGSRSVVAVVKSDAVIDVDL